jgi:predicted DCC family thiol-disulfide oxidoreductase YuxK
MDTMLTALYDGRCVICRSTCEAMRALDWRKRIAFVDLHDNGAWQEGCPDLTLAQLMREIHVLDGEGKIYAGFEGARRMLREAPLGFPLWLLLLLPGMHTLGARVYRFIAGRRYRINALFGKKRPDCADGSCELLR